MIHRSSKTVVLTWVSAVDNFASKEGVPSGADSFINKEVDSEANKVL